MAADPKKQLSLLDSTCIIVGIIIGAGIYQMTPDIAKGASNGGGLLLLWLAGGLISLCGALGYAELAAAYPFQGGDYVYLSRAYGRWAGFLFGWLQVAIVRPGDIAVMAFAFAAYAQVICDPFAGRAISYDWIPLKSYAGLAIPAGQLLYAGGAVAVLTALNILGVREGKWTQNLLTLVKALGLLFIVGAALRSPAPPEVNAPYFSPLPPSLALIFILFTFGGWNEIAYVAAEVKNPRRNMVRALVLGLLSVTVLYLLVNGAFLHSLGYRGIAASQAVAADSIAASFPRRGGQIISALICLSALGAVSGLIFTGARISYALGTGHRVFRVLGRWNARTGTPLRALLLQGLLAIGLIVVLGSFVNTILYTAAAVYTFYLATSISVILLRRKEPRIERPYRVTAYPLPTLLFSAVCAWLIYSSVSYAIAYKPVGLCISLGVFMLGIVLYRISTAR